MARKFTSTIWGLLINQIVDVSDLRNHTEYQNGGFDQHPVIRMLWQILNDFNSQEKRAFLKFVTSSPKVSLDGGPSPTKCNLTVGFVTSASSGWI